MKINKFARIITLVGRYFSFQRMNVYWPMILTIIQNTQTHESPVSLTTFELPRINKMLLQKVQEIYFNIRMHKTFSVLIHMAGSLLEFAVHCC